MAAEVVHITLVLITWHVAKLYSLIYNINYHHG